MHKILAKHFASKLNRVRCKVWALLGSLVFLSIFYFLMPHIDPLPYLNLTLNKGINFTMLPIIVMEDDQNVNSLRVDVIEPKQSITQPRLELKCNFSGAKSDFCDIIGDIRIEGDSSSIFFTSPQLPKKPGISKSSIVLYARKQDKFVMEVAKEKELSLKPTLLSNQELPRCTVNHTVPAIVFSAGGYAGNFFHDFSDVLIPLYLTSIQFNGQVQFLAQNRNSWWIKRHELMLKVLSKYDIIDLDRDKEVRCFNKATIGLKAPMDYGLIVHQISPYGYTLRNFTQFTRRVYSLDRNSIIKIRAVDNDRKPRLVVLARNKTRAFMNEDEIAAEARSIGFDVEVISGKLGLQDFSRIVNSADVMLGVHGAGMTNMIFLPENAVLIQVVPLALKDLAYVFYEKPARNLNLRYLEYNVSDSESTLSDQYPKDNLVFKDPKFFKKQGWAKYKSIYLDQQNVRLDMSKFRTVLLEAFTHVTDQDSAT